MPRKPLLVEKMYMKMRDRPRVIQTRKGKMTLAKVKKIDDTKVRLGVNTEGKWFTFRKVN